MIEITIKGPGEFRESKWRGGVTRELFVYPSSTDNASRNFEIRVSSATVELDESKFSDFSGYVRHIAPISGAMTLTHGGGEGVILSRGMTHTFDGGAETLSRGRCVDFNLIHAGGWMGRLAPAERDGAAVTASSGFTGCYAATGACMAGVSFGEGTHGQRKLDVSLREGEFLAAGSDGSPITLSVQPSGDGAFAILFSADRVL
jgi:environmental stress-induced protein Ves